MIIKLEGEKVCSICGAKWEPYKGFYGDESIQCAFCGASPSEKELPVDEQTLWEDFDAIN